MIKDQFFIKTWETQFKKRVEGLRGVRIFESRSKFHPYTAILKIEMHHQYIYLPVSLRENSEEWNAMVEAANKTLAASYLEAREKRDKIIPFLKTQTRGLYCYEHGVKKSMVPETTRKMAEKATRYGNTLEKHMRWLETTDIKKLFEECDKEREEV